MQPLLLLATLLGLATPALAQESEEVEPTPWQVQIYSNFTGWTKDELAKRGAWDLAHRCGGTLIARDWVLTAAHCINQDKVDKGYRVRLGADRIDTGEGATYRIDRMVRHADWDGANHLYDIAVVHFVADDQTDTANAGPIKALPLYGGPPLQPGVNLFATGWGQAEEGRDKGFQAELTSVELKTVNCQNYPQYRGKTPEYQMCATSRVAGENADTCTGDSGGPLVLDGTQPLLVGVVNWGKGCYRDRGAGVYIRIDRNHFRDWIARAMASDPSVNTLR